MTYASVNHDVQAAGVAFTPMIDKQKETIGQRIALGMQIRGVPSQAKLAELLGVSRMTVNQWVNGISEPRPENLTAIAALLFDGDVLYLVHGATREPVGGFRTLPPLPPGPDSSGSGRFVSPFRRSNKT